MNKPYPKYKDGTPIHWNWYKENTHGYTDLVQKSLTYLKDCSGTILDIGSGDGLIDSLLYEQGFQVIGMEPEKDGIKIAYPLVPYKILLQTNIEKYVERAMIPVEYMYSMNTIEHVDDPQAFVKVMKSVENFALVFTDNAVKNKEIGKDHQREYTFEQLQDLFKDFKTEQLDTGNDNFIGIKIYANR